MVKEATKPVVEKEEEKYRQAQFPDVKKVLQKNMLCTSCNSSVKQLVLKGSPRSHPFMETLLCEKCFSFFGDGDFSVDEDGSDKYCRWCGQGGTLFLCSKCTAGFCKKCIKRNLPRSVLKDVEEDDWECLCCNVKPLYELRAHCWAALKYAETTKGKSDSSSRKRKTRMSDSEEDDDSDSNEKAKKSKKSKDSSGSSRRGGSGKTEKDSSPDVEESEASKTARKSTRERKSKSKSSPGDGDSDDEKTPGKTDDRESRRSSSRKTKNAKKDEPSDVEDSEVSKKVRKSTRDRKTKSKSSPGEGESDEEETPKKTKSKSQIKQFKLARSKLSTALVDLVKLNDVTKNKAISFKKKYVTAQKVHDVETFQTTAQRLTALLQSVEDLTKKMRVTFSEFVTKFENTVGEMNKSEENGQAEENGDTTSKEDKMEVEEGDYEKSAKEAEESDRDKSIKEESDDDKLTKKESVEKPTKKDSDDDKLTKEESDREIPAEIESEKSIAEESGKSVGGGDKENGDVEMKEDEKDEKTTETKEREESNLEVEESAKETVDHSHDVDKSGTEERPENESST